MNGQRLVIGLIVFLLSLVCLTQTPMIGCAGEPPADDVTVSDSDGVPFFRRADNEAPGEPTSWRPVSENVLSQIEDIYGDFGLVVKDLQRSESGARAMRCVLESRDGLSGAKELLDGLFLLHQTYPERQLYIVQIDGETGRQVEAGWEDLVALSEAGYSFETPSEQADRFWVDIFAKPDTEEPDTDGTATAEIESG